MKTTLYFLFALIILAGCANATELHAQQAESAKLQSQVIDLQKQLAKATEDGTTCQTVLINIGKAYNATMSAVGTAYEVAKPVASSAYETAKPVVVQAVKDAYHTAEPVVEQKAHDAGVWLKQKYEQQTTR